MNGTSMATDLWPNDWRFIWPDRRFYVQPEAYNSQPVIAKTGDPLPVPSPLSPEPLTRRPPNGWHIFQPMEFQNGNMFFNYLINLCFV